MIAGGGFRRCSSALCLFVFLFLEARSTHKVDVLLPCPPPFTIYSLLLPGVELSVIYVSFDVGNDKTDNVIDDVSDDVVDDVSDDAIDDVADGGFDFSNKTSRVSLRPS